MRDKPILCLDFDGVIHGYQSGWKGALTLPDPPVPGALEFIVRMADPFNLQIFSARSGEPGGIEAMRSWLFLELKQLYSVTEAVNILHKITWPTRKPPAFLTIDDRAVQFTGDWNGFTEEFIRSFKPWNKQ